jgi:hypothetical protein
MLSVLVAGALGYATGGPDGGAVAAIALALGVGAVAGVAWTADALVGRLSRTRVTPILAGGLAVVGWVVVPTAVIGSDASASIPLWATVGGVWLVGVFVGVTCDSPLDGLWYGLLAGGTGGVLFVYVAIYESFTMRPELEGIVLIAGVFAPLALALVGGFGGAVGVSTLDAVWTRRMSE